MKKNLQFLWCFKGKDVYIDWTKEDATDLQNTLTEAIKELDMYRAIEKAKIFNEKFPKRKVGILERWFLS